ncbi:MAG: Uncharacterized protein K0R09_1171 [Clostridiales bacterium]|jgi:hypothetical protein|nr:Uncharacterized protein [Clostridiales bacterium]
MQVFTTPVGKFKDLADKYKKSGEISRISLPIEYDGKRYKEIVYNKKFLGRMKKNVEGVIFLTDDGEYISDIRLKKELSILGYQLEVIMDDKSINDLKSAITPELEIEKQVADYNQIKKAIDNMKASKEFGVDTVVPILNKLPDLKRENNKVIEVFINKLQLLNPDGFVFNTSVYNELYTYYKEILIKNFQRVRLVGSGRNFYDNLKKEAQKRKRNMSARFNGHEVFMGLTKLPYEMDHLKNIIKVYESVVNMKQEEYLKHLKIVEKTNIDYRIQLIR